MIEVADRLKHVEEYYFSKKLKEVHETRFGKDILT